jgi:hypothetical protein
VAAARARGLLPSSLSKPGNFDYTLCGNFLVFKKRSLSLCGNNSPLSELHTFSYKTVSSESVKQWAAAALLLATWYFNDWPVLTLSVCLLMLPCAFTLRSRFMGCSSALADCLPASHAPGGPYVSVIACARRCCKHISLF